MQKSNQRTSFHGKLIKSVIEYWYYQFLYQQNDIITKNKLSNFLCEYIPIIDFEIKWDNSNEIIDNNSIVGNIFYLDENKNNKNMMFCFGPKIAKIEED